LRIKQSYDPLSNPNNYPDYDFGADQPVVPYFEETNINGTVAYLYENLNTSSGRVAIGDLSATQSQDSINASLTEDLSFSLSRVIRVGDNSDATSQFEVDVEEYDANNYPGVEIPRLFANSSFVYRGNSYDEYIVYIRVIDENIGDTSAVDLTVGVHVRNSKPTISTILSPIEVIAAVGEGSRVLTSDNDVTNGGMLAGGVINKYYDIRVTHTFSANPQFDKLFEITRPTKETYELETTSEWTQANAEDFFNSSNSGRQITITATDSGGLSTSTTAIVVEKQVTVLTLTNLATSPAKILSKGELGDLFYNNTYEQRGSIGAYVTAGDSGDDPIKHVFPSSYEPSYKVEIKQGNILWTKSDLSEKMPQGYYAIETRYNGDTWDGLSFHLDENGVVDEAYLYTGYPWQA
jgi:hypothetical protein